MEDIDIVIAVCVSLDFHKMYYSPKSYATQELKAWSALANCVTKRADV